MNNASAPKPPPSYDDLAEVIRQIGPALARIDAQLHDFRSELKFEVGRLDQRIDKLEATVDQRIDKLEARIENRFVSMDGRFAAIEGHLKGFEFALRQVPTIWAMGAMVIGIFGLSFALLRFGIPH